MDMVGKKLRRYMWDKTWEKPVDGNGTRVMIEKCLDIIDHSSDLAEAQYLSQRCIEKIVGYSTDQSMNKAAQTADSGSFPVLEGGLGILPTVSATIKKRAFSPI